MDRKAQLWRFCDKGGAPLGDEIPGIELHKMINELAGNPLLTITDAKDYKTRLAAIPGEQPHFVLHNVRETNLPSQVQGDEISPLNPDIDGLAEATHILLRPGNLVIFVASGYSPRPPRLAAFIRKRLGWDVWLKPVLRKDAGDVLGKITKVSNVELAIPASDVRQMDLAGFFQEDDDPIAALQAAARAQQGGVIRLGFGIGRGSGADQGWFKRLVRRLESANLDRFTTVRANVYVEGSKDQIPVDFLHDKIVATVDVGDAVGRSRDIKAQGALAGMVSAAETFANVVDLDALAKEVAGGELDLPKELISDGTDGPTGPAVAKAAHAIN